MVLIYVMMSSVHPYEISQDILKSPLDRLVFECNQNND